MKKILFSFLFVGLLVPLSGQALSPIVACAPGDLFNRYTGERCVVAGTIPGCLPGYNYSPITGQKCSVVDVVPPSNYCALSHLKVGSKGHEVIQLQDKLITNGYLVMPYGVAKGYYGNLTAQAVARAKAAGLYNCEVVKTASVKVVSPNGGERWLDHQVANIVWDPIGCAGCQYFARYNPAVDINLFSQSANLDCRQAGGEVCPQDISAMYNLDRNVSRTNSSYGWIVATDINDQQIPAGRYKVQVCVAGTADCDFSDNYFEIIQAQAN